MQSKTENCIGIIGDGQLALMLAEALTKKQIRFCCLSTSENSPMRRSFPAQTTQDNYFFFTTATIFSLENEFLTVAQLNALLGKKVSNLFPDIKSYSHFSDKISQRLLFDQIGLRSPKWLPLVNNDDLLRIKAQFAYPFMLKSSQGGYDGKGVREIKNEVELGSGLNDFGFYQGKPLLIEEKIKLEKEVAQGFVRNGNGDYTLLPLVETVQHDGVCNLVYYPADVSELVTKQINTMIKTLIDYPLIGIFNFEFFVDDQDRVTINEGAPRPHNSQHLTINASNHSQFDVLAMYLTHQGPFPKELETRPAAMINILGQTSGADYQLTLPSTNEQIQIDTKLYGKEQCSPGRKMGHVNIVDESGKTNLRNVAEEILREYKI